jgi:CubicO group peptidase (beta-lactamase class C family)
LAADPGTRWEYSDPSYCHLSLAFAHATGREIADVLEQHVFKPIGIEHASWDVQGGSGFLGPHTNPHTGLHLSARELARFGYLALHGGRWGEEDVLPADWQAKVRQPSQEFNPAYGYGWWTNARETYAQGLPTDLFALAGFAGNRCYIVPSLDLVVARVGTGPFALEERSIMAPIADAILE